MEHPGVLFRQEWFKGLDDREMLSQAEELARRMDYPLGQLLQFFDGKRDVDAELAEKMAARFNTTDAYWLGMQLLYDKKKNEPQLP